MTVGGMTGKLGCSMVLGGMTWVNSADAAAGWVCDCGTGHGSAAGRDVGDDGDYDVR